MKLSRALLMTLIVQASLIGAAFAQVSGGVTSSGPVTPGHIATFKSKAQIQDGGAPVISGTVAGGDLSGTYPNPKVIKLQAVPVAVTTPLDTQCLVYDGPGSTWKPGSCAAGGAGTVTSVTATAGTGITLSGTCASVSVFSCTFGLTPQITAAGPIGGATAVPQITFNASGQLTTVTSVPIAISFSQVSGTLPSGQFGPLSGDVVTSGYAATIQANAITTAKILDANVTNAKLSNMAANTVKGSIAGGVPADLSATQLTTLCNVATNVLKGCLPILSNVTTQYFAGDGTFRALPAPDVTSVATAGLATGGPITSTGTVTVTAATKTDQQTGTSSVVAVTPSQQQSHDSAAKAWVMFTGAGAVLTSYNVTGISQSGAGIYTATFTIPFASANYACVLTGETGGAPTTAYGLTTGKTAGAFQMAFTTVTTTPVAANPAFGSIVCYGRQ